MKADPGDELGGRGTKPLLTGDGHDCVPVDILCTLQVIHARKQGSHSQLAGVMQHPALRGEAAVCHLQASKISIATKRLYKVTIR